MNARALKILAATKLLPLLLLLALPAVAQAQLSYLTPEGTIYYEDDGGYITIDSYSGSDSTLTIPNTINGEPVTYIGERAFEYCSSLTSVTICGTNVTSIEDYAFYEDSSLTNVTMGTNVDSIGNSAFQQTSLTSVIIPDSVGYLGDEDPDVSHGAFSYCLNLTSVTIGNGVGEIGSQTFFGDSSLTSVTMGTNVNYIGVSAFEDCGLTSVTIPASVTDIGDGAFNSCPLTSVTIPDSVGYLGDGAFAGCSSLTNVTIGNGVTSIGGSAFQACSNLPAVYFEGNSPTPTNDLSVFSGDKIGTVYYNPSTTGWGTNFDGWPTMPNSAVTNAGSVTQVVGSGVKVTRLDGSVYYLQAGQVGFQLMQGDVIKTDKSSAVNIQLADNTFFAVSESASLNIDQFVYHPADQTGSAFFSMLQGVFVYIGGLMEKKQPAAVNVETPVGSIGIRGTEFITSSDPCSSIQTVYLIQGELAITPLNTPGVTNICDAPVTICITPCSVTTNILTQAMYNSISNQLLQAIGTFPAWQEQYFGCTNDPDAAPAADPDGDGVDNYSEFLAGTDPTSSSSYFHILSAAPVGKDMLVTWLCGSGQTNVLQATTNLGGSWSNVSPNIVLAGSGDSVTNYLDVGGFTNSPARFYRVRLLP